MRKKNGLFIVKKNSKVSLTPATFIYFLATPCGLQDLSSLTRDQICAPSSGSIEFNHWTPRGVPLLQLLASSLSLQDPRPCD